MVLSASAWFGCGDHNMLGDDVGDDVVPDASSTAVAGHALILKGPSATGGAAQVVGPLHAGPPADGRWAISPDEATLTLTSIDLVRDDGQPYSFDFVDCRPTYRADSESLTELLDCPFQIEPGSYVALGVSASTTYELVLDDEVNGFFTDPAETTKVRTTGTGPGQPVSFTVPGPGGIGDELNFNAYLVEPLVVAEGDAAVSVQILVDMIHTLGITVDGGVATVETSAPELPTAIVASASGAGKSEFYNAVDSAVNLRIGPVGQTSTWGGARVFYIEGDQPSYLFHPVPGPSQSYSVDPSTAPWNALEFKAGGYLGVDDTDTMCWAMPSNDPTWTVYALLCRMALTTAGGTTTIECQNTTTVPAPTSGTTYASGCPTLSQVDASMTVHLIAN